MESIGNITNPPGIHSELSNQSHIANYRIKRLQQELKQYSLDGVLIVNGIDSKYSVDARNLTLMILGYTSPYKSNSKEPPFDIDDIVILIEIDKVHIYLLPSIYSSLFPIIKSIANHVLYCLDTESDFPLDTLEDHKVYSFIEMTRDVTSLGIPYSHFEKKNFDFMKVEKWPIFQAYALEAYGQNGFFTVSHELKVFDYLESNCFKGFDGASLLQVLTNTVSVFVYQWDVFIRNFYISLLNQEQENVTSFTDSLQSYVNHGTKSKGSVKSYVQNHVGPGNLLFVSCIVKEPQGSVQAARTYFAHSIPSPDLILVSCIYDAMVHATHQTIQRYLSLQNSAKLLSYFSKKFFEKSANCKFNQLNAADFKQMNLDISVSFECYNCSGDKVTSSTISTMKVLNVRVNNIPSVDKEGRRYDGLMFGETFVDSYLKVVSGEECGKDSDLIIVTDNIPTYIHVNSPPKTDLNFIPCTLLNYNSKDIYDASFQLTDTKICINSEYSPPIAIDISAVKTAIINRAGSVSVLMYLEYSSSCLVPFNKRVAVTFWQRGKGYKFCMDTLIPLLKKKNIEFKTEGIPKNMVLRFDKYMMFKSHSSDKELLSARYPTLNSFLPHYNLSCVGDFTYPQSDINPHIQIPNHPHVYITLVIGIPGSHQDEVTAAITRNGERYLIVRQAHGADSLFSLPDLQTSLEKIASQHKEEIRVVVVVSDYVETSTVVGGIVNHPTLSVRAACYISCVNCCVDARNIFLCNQTPYPKLMEQLQEGWVNNIIISGLQKSKEKSMKFIKEVNPNARIIEFTSNQILDVDDLHAARAKDKFYEGNLPVTRHINAPGWWCRKYAPCSTYITVDYIPMRFHGTLDKARLMVQLKKLHQKEGRVFLDRLLMFGSIFYIKGYVDIDKKSYEVSYCPRSDTISLSVIDDISENCFIFTGYKLSREQVQAWLQSCTPKSPAKKALYTKETLDSSDLQLLHEKELKLPLPAGWFYNGSSYISMQGEKRPHHPQYDDIVKEYLKDKNLEIIKHNEDVEKFTVTTLF